jgi:ABC-type transporter Mla subunit MlaD
VNMRVVSEHALIAVDNVNSVVATNTTSIAAAVSNLVYFSEQLNDFAGALNGVVSTNGAQLTSAMKNIESSTMVLKNVLNDVESGKGLAGALVRNENMAANVSTIASNLTITSSNLNRLGLWGILWQHKPEKKSEPSRSRELNSPKNHPE